MDIKKAAEDLESELVSMRRYFHEHPERSWEEHNTQKKIEAWLDELGIPYVEAVRTGVIATIKGKNSGNRVIGIRADIDALPIEEQGTCVYKSQNLGTMHACGHDAHITILMGTAKVLAEHRDELKDTVRLIFQPAEESIEDSGAYYMKDEPLVKECETLIGLHIWAEIEAGYASLRFGPVMASADTFDIYIEGKGGHGAHPDGSIDPIAAGIEVVENLNRLVAREIDPLKPAVISVTSFHAGTTSNVIPGTAHLSGTTRAFDNTLRNNYPDIMKRVLDGVAEATRTKIRLDYHWGPPVTVNDEAPTKLAESAAAKVFGKEHVIQYPLQMAGEDFAKYTNPKCFLLLGGGVHDPAGRYPQHSPYFDIDESVLKLGVEYFVQYVMDYGKEPKGRS